MKLIVLAFEYSPDPTLPEYLAADCIDTRPAYLRFEIGEVVVVTSEFDGTLSIEVVIGCIDVYRKALRTTLGYDIEFKYLRSATMDDFDIPGIRFSKKVFDDCVAWYEENEEE